MDSISPGPLSRCTSIAAAIIVSVSPAAFWYNGCIGPELNRSKQREQRIAFLSLFPLFAPVQSGGVGEDGGLELVMPDHEGLDSCGDVIFVSCGPPLLGDVGGNEGL